MQTGMFGYVAAAVWVLLAGALPWPAYLLPCALGVLRCGRRVALPLLCAFLVADIHVGATLARALAQRVSAYDQTVRVQGEIRGLLRTTPSEWSGEVSCQRFLLALAPDRIEGANLSARQLQVSVCESSAPALLPGDVIVLTLRLRPPWGQLNRHAGDTERWALAAGIDGYASGAAVQHLARPRFNLDRWRQHCVERLRARFPESAWAAALLPALVAGDRSHLDAQQWRFLRELGLAHLVAISGLHVGLVAGLSWWLFSALLALLMSPGNGVLAARRWALPPALLLAVGYSALAGFSLPTQRALLMLVMVSLSLVGVWSIRPITALLAALVLILIWQPLAALSPGLWMSVSAVLLILLQQMLAGASLMRMQWQLSWLGGLLGGWLFGVFRPVSVLANLLLVPVFSLFLIPAALLGALVPGMAPLLHLCAWVLEGAGRLLQLLVQAPAIPLPGSALALAAALLAGWRWLTPALPGPRWLWLALLTPWCWPASQAPAQGEFDVISFDVGQGQMQLIRTADHLLLYDSGPVRQQDSAVDTVLRPWLGAQRQPINVIVHSHGDADHIGGLADLPMLAPHALYLSGQPSRTPGHLPCRRGQRWRWDGVTIEVLWPPAQLPIQRGNNHSCVLSVRSRAGAALLTGDIEKPVEYWLSEVANLMPVDLLSVPHHGSQTSSSFSLLRQLQPGQASVSAGKDNRFGHPAASTRQRYQDAGITLFTTADTGMQVFRFRLPGGLAAAPQLWREQSSWPWRLPMPVIE